MADNKQISKLEIEYIIPLRRAWINVPEYKRARKAVLTIKTFIAKHMKVKDRDIDNVKLDVYLNNDIWFKGRSKPPSKIKVKVIKEGDNVLVKFAETPQYVRFLKLKHTKIHKKPEEKKKETKVEEKKEEKKPETKTEEQKVDEKEKGKSVEQQNIKQAEQQVKAQKHTTKSKEQQIHRMALKK